jgi:hypothetical protein
MDVYEKGILLGAIPCTVWLGWFWRPLRILMLVVAAVALMAVGLYQQDGAGNLARADTVFGLKYEHAVFHQHGVLLDWHVFTRRGPDHEHAGLAHRLGGRGNGAHRHAGALV